MRLAHIAVGEPYAALVHPPEGRSIADRPYQLASMAVVLKVEMLTPARRSDLATRGAWALSRILDWRGDFDGVPQSKCWVPANNPAMVDQWFVRPRAFVCPWSHYETVVDRHTSSKLHGVGLAQSLATITGGTTNYDPLQNRVAVHLSPEDADKLVRRLNNTVP